ncbi:MAG TPA: RHS repeat-associated core domain-containing protein, partial [Opitutales bacterium]|nr:RHS repeat-associated core domain-containing protein [Opitutales bacterium]
DKVGNQIAYVDAEGNRTEYRYNAMGWLTQTILPGGQTESYTYDAFGNQLTRADAEGYTTSYSYDVMNRLIRTEADPTHPSLILDHAPAVIETSYNADGTIASSQVRNASTDLLYSESMSYDARGRLIEKATSSGTLTYSYTENGLVETVSSEAADGLSLGYSYDAANRLIGVADDRSALPDASYSYDANGNLAGVDLPNGIGKSFSYNSRNQLIDLRIENGASSLLRSYAYSLNSRGDRLRVEEAGGRVRDYAYDDLYRLTSEEFSGGGLAAGTVGYGLDAVGNRLSRSSSFGPIAAQALTFDENNRINGTSYDANGNILNSPLTPISYQGMDIYDFRDRLIRRERIDGTNVDLLYDAGGIRVRKTITAGASSELTNYLVDANNPSGYAQVVEERDGSGSLLAIYAYGSDLLSRRDNFGGTPEIRFFIHDGSGSVVALSDEGGTIVEAYAYDAYGNRIDGGGPADSQYLYRGEQFDRDLGLYYLRARYMDPGTGRFWTMDRFEGFIEDPLSLHKYLYAHGNPVTYEDPAGQFSIAGLNVTFSITANLRNVQALHIQKATATISKQFVKIAVASAERYLDFRGYATFNLSPITNASVYVPQFQAFTLAPGGTLILDLLYTETLTFLVGAALAGGISHIAGKFDVIKIKAKVSVGKFSMELKKLYKYIKKVGAAVGEAINDYAQTYAIVRLASQAKNVYDLLKAFQGKVETAAKYSPLVLVAFDYWILQKARLQQIRAAGGF